MLPEFGHALTQMLRHYMRESYRTSSDVSMESALADGVDTRLLAIGFADLAGSTALADRSSLADLGEALDGFERTAADIVAGRGGRIVKFIGDEVMFRADSPDAACEVAVDLVEAVRADAALPPLRIGIAYGNVLSREGDFYGPIVNVAARVAKLAPLDGIVATRDIADALQHRGRFAVESLGAIEIRGVSDPVDLVALHPRSPT
jgi:adenylate cyclase